MRRYCEQAIRADLKKKMVFIGGPRQVGKTTLSKQLCYDEFAAYQYFNWDVSEDRRAIFYHSKINLPPIFVTNIVQ